MSNHVYKHIELTGSSTKTIEDAVSGAIAKRRFPCATSTGSRWWRRAATWKTEKWRIGR